MAASPPDLIGRLAIHYKLITMDQLREATRVQSHNPNKQLGHIMVELDQIDQKQLAQLVEAQRQQQAKKQEPAPPPPPDREPIEELEFDEAEEVQRPKTEAQIKWLNKVLAKAASMKASDVHIHAGIPIRARIYGQLINLSAEPLSSDHTESVLLAVLDEQQKEELAEEGQIDFAYAIPGVGRFRANIYGQHGGLCAAYHIVPEKPPSLADLGLPSSLAKLTNNHNGIVLITGTAGCGKTSTMAALVNLINEERNDHILTIEDPIEYVHKAKGCVVNQRAVHHHTRSFAAALRSALREDPDVICIGELRDLETISLAMSASQTGHLVLGTMHTIGAIRTLNRLVGAYPPSQQSQIRVQLSESLRAIISQKLIRRSDGTGMALALEVLLVNQATANLIRENKTFQINSVLQTGRKMGMIAFDDSLAGLVSAGKISKKVAKLHADNPANFA